MYSAEILCRHLQKTPAVSVPALSPCGPQRQEYIPSNGGRYYNICTYRQHFLGANGKDPTNCGPLRGKWSCADALPTLVWVECLGTRLGGKHVHDKKRLCTCPVLVKYDEIQCMCTCTYTYVCIHACARAYRFSD